MDRFIHILWFVLLVAGVSQAQHRDHLTIIQDAVLIDTNLDDPSPLAGQAVQIHIKDDKISGVFSASTPLPPSANIIDASGRYVLPGMIDSMGAMKHQGFADAYLSAGVTSVIVAEGGRRGMIGKNISPTPHIYKIHSIGKFENRLNFLLKKLEHLHQKGAKIVFFMYQVYPHQLRALTAKARELDMTIIGELGHTKYLRAIDYGFDAFIHSTRYLLDLAPVEMRRALVKDPMNPSITGPKWTYYRFLSQLDLEDRRVQNYLNALATSDSYLIPTASVLYLFSPQAINPWKTPFGQFVTPFDIHEPAHPETGSPMIKPEFRQLKTELFKSLWKIEKFLADNGARYIAGSGTNVWGTMPGFSLHTELSYLESLGLDRQTVLASATSHTAKKLRLKRGLIKKGYYADLVLLDKNPLENLQHLTLVSRVFVDGQQVWERDKINE